MLRKLFSTKKRLAIVVVVCLLLSPAFWVAAKLIKTPHSNIWVGAYTKDLIAGRYHRAAETQDLFFMLCDHWEPGGGEKNIAAAREWLRRYRDVVADHHDSQGRLFQYTWFYPIDNMEDEVLAELSRAVGEGYGEIEVHWHHNHHSSAKFEQDLKNGLAVFMRHDALIDHPGGEPHWSFIHGNWALDGTKPHRCGITDEISILQRNGCYGDFTFPALGTVSQPSTINRITWIHDTPAAKSYDHGLVSQVGREGEGFLMFPGPLGLNFRNMLVLIENGAIDNSEGTGFCGMVRPPSGPRDYFKPARIPLWDNIHVSVEGKPEWCFVKTHAHGMAHKVVLAGELDAMLDALEQYCSARGIRLHYITTREAFNLVKAAERGLEGDPTDYYDLVIPPPLNRKTSGLR